MNTYLNDNPFRLDYETPELTELQFTDIVSGNQGSAKDLDMEDELGD